MKPECSDCRFACVLAVSDWRKDAAWKAQSGNVRRVRVCRRHAPALGGWPQVGAEDWCGEYEQCDCDMVDVDEQ